MHDTVFPRTTVGGVSLSRMIIGTNWMLGWSHTSGAADTLIARAAPQPRGDRGGRRCVPRARRGRGDGPLR